MQKNPIEILCRANSSSDHAFMVLQHKSIIFLKFFVFVGYCTLLHWTVQTGWLDYAVVDCLATNLDQGRSRDRSWGFELWSIFCIKKSMHTENAKNWTKLCLNYMYHKIRDFLEQNAWSCNSKLYFWQYHSLEVLAFWIAIDITAGLMLCSGHI